MSNEFNYRSGEMRDILLILDEFGGGLRPRETIDKLINALHGFRPLVDIPTCVYTFNSNFNAILLIF